VAAAYVEPFNTHLPPRRKGMMLIENTVTVAMKSATGQSLCNSARLHKGDSK
jgi:hypothetical protein